jgi:hypothetical protein
MMDPLVWSPTVVRIQFAVDAAGASPGAGFFAGSVGST